MSYLTELVDSAIADISQASDVSALDNVRTKYLGKKGYLTLKIDALRELPLEERPAMGAIVNEWKKQIQQALNIRKAELENAALNATLTTETIDVSLPGRHVESGRLHPITSTTNYIESFFRKLGFTTKVGPEIEDNYHNFDALNIPDHHPSRTARDTFWFDDTRLLRTQTSNVQIRTMESQQPPIRIIAPGRVYRNDYDRTHTPMFHQMEGLVIDQNVNFANLKWILRNFIRSFFKENLQIRFHPSYFPFTEPSAEIDIMDKDGKWLEIIGCGIVHRNVLCNVGIDPDIYSGFAFGIGIERLTMLRYGITDLRVFFENDLRFLTQFKLEL